jgi:hypothetical protein
MRIVIEIEGDRVISATVEGSTSAGGPPQEVLEAARARGAISAGRAPLNPSGAGTQAAAPQDAGATRSAAKRPAATGKTPRATGKRQGARARQTRR